MFSSVAGSGTGIEGVAGADNSSRGTTASPPKASSNSAVLAFLLPSFIPEPLKAGARSDDDGVEVEVEVVTGWGDGASYRGTGE